MMHLSPNLTVNTTEIVVRK